MEIRMMIIQYTYMHMYISSSYFASSRNRCNQLDVTYSDCIRNVIIPDRPIDTKNIDTTIYHIKTIITIPYYNDI